eukprot:TRINITY_DN83627_c0_g1_i1.p1 TRINITY_DN83627_c0_g1~~TRINITY_DN83627_c0_g1_i1.p1  ORF type:complete len:746 (-),score=158.28 TRINITY_DN83627_c0_g1_i1:95-2332(-)
MAYQDHGNGWSLPPTDANLNCLSQEYPYDEILAATDGLCTASRIGKGMYGSVYQGTLRDGTEVAVKALSRPNEAGFREEVEVLSRFRHPNLVILMGFARAPAQSKERYLVYELLSGGDVCSRLQKGPPFPWRARFTVALDAALGLSHLHGSRPQVFHRDIKSQNILMDRNGTGKMADFGLALLAQPNCDSMTVEQASGTMGYADPLYIRTGKVTERSEIYSFGMVVMELLTGRPPALQHVDGRIELQFSHICGDVSRVLPMVDRRIAWPASIVDFLARLSLRCSDDVEQHRPTFAEVVAKLRQTLREDHEEKADAPPTAMPVMSAAALHPSPSASFDPYATGGFMAQPQPAAPLQPRNGAMPRDADTVPSVPQLRPSQAARDLAQRVLQRSNAHLASETGRVVDRLPMPSGDHHSSSATAAGSMDGRYAAGVQSRSYAASDPVQEGVEDVDIAIAAMMDCGPTARLDCGLPSDQQASRVEDRGRPEMDLLAMGRPQMQVGGSSSSGGGVGRSADSQAGRPAASAVIDPYGAGVPSTALPARSAAGGGFAGAAATANGVHALGSRDYLLHSNVDRGRGLDQPSGPYDGGSGFVGSVAWIDPRPQAQAAQPPSVFQQQAARMSNADLTRVSAAAGSVANSAANFVEPLHRSAPDGEQLRPPPTNFPQDGGFAQQDGTVEASPQHVSAYQQEEARRELEIQRLHADDIRSLQEDMGFSAYQALEAFKRCSTLAAAVEWIIEPDREWNR